MIDTGPQGHNLLDKLPYGRSTLKCVHPIERDVTRMTRIDEDLVNRIADLPPQGLSELLDFLETDRQSLRDLRAPRSEQDDRDPRD